MRDEYVMVLTAEEEEFCRLYRKESGLDGGEMVVGFNTGCSDLYPNKKMRIDQHVELIRRISAISGVRILLVGGPEDRERNAEIARQVGDSAISTPTNEGLRRGLCYINLCDVVISGDSFGMHAAIGLKKYVIVWFGVSCWTEIDLFDRGEKLIPKGLECSPCWNKECPYDLECIDMIDLDRIVELVAGRAKSIPRRRILAGSEANS
jgi:heptosyltransferase-2